VNARTSDAEASSAGNSNARTSAVRTPTVRTSALAKSLAALGAVALLVTGCSGSGSKAPVAASYSASPDAPGGSTPAASPGGQASSQPPTSTGSASASATPGTDPGTLPQTHVMPTATDPVFQTGVKALWQAVVDDNPAEAKSFFFPETAYVQVKSLKDATADYQNRLIGFYDADIHAAHQLLGADAASAQFVSVTVPAQQAQWIKPGVESNKESYYRVYGTRLTYHVGGKTKSFGLYSLISWRGVWYVVHLGPNPRPKPVGAVYQPRG
jgi:hypothetical protein